MDTLTTEEFGATIRLKYSEYSKYSNKEIAKRMLLKYPQYAEKISDLEKPEKKSLFRKVGDFFTSSTQKLGGTLGQIGATDSVLKGTPEIENRLTDTEIQLRRRIAENKRAGKDTARLEKELNTFTGRQTTGEQIGEIIPGIEKSNKRVLGEIVGTGVEALSGGVASGVRGAGLAKVAPTATSQAAQKAQFLAKPLSGRLADIGIRTGKNVAQITPFGYAIDVARNLEEDKSGASIFKPGMATLISALIPASIGGVQATRQIASAALSRGIAPNLSGVPSAAFERMRTGDATRHIGKVTPESVLDEARASASAFKSTMQKEFGKGQEAIITEFTGRRISLPEKTGNMLEKIANRFGFEDRLPLSVQEMSAKETMDLLAEINHIKPVTAIDDPLVRSLKLNLGQVKSEIVNLARQEFGGKGGAFEKLYADYTAKSTILKNIQSIVGKIGLKPGSMRLTPVQHQTATRRLQKVFNDDAEGFLKVIQDLGDETGEKILDKIAASQLSKIMPKSFRVNVSAVPAFNMATSGGLGLINDIVSALTLPLSSPRMSAWIIRKVGGYDPSAVTSLLNAVPSVRNAIYNAVHKENMAFTDAVELYAKDYLKSPKLGLAIEDVSGGAQKRLNSNAASGKTTQISTKNTTTAPITSSIDASMPQPKKKASEQGFKNFTDLSTKLLGKLEGRSSVSKQFISDLTNSPDLKQPERDLFREILKGEGDTIDVPTFANKVKTELLPLKPAYSDTPRYESISLSEETRGNVANYFETVYESPIKTSAGDVHTWDVDAPNYFAHTRVEDMAPAKNSEALNKVGWGKGVFELQKEAEKLGKGGDTRRVIELQSDLFQKGRLEQESIKGLDTADLKIPSGLKVSDPRYKAAVDKITNQKKAELSKLEPYRNTWQERIIREEVKQAAIDGKTKLQFPTGETAMKIEGLGENATWVNDSGVVLDKGNLKVGEEIIQGTAERVNPMSSSWIITDVLGDGKFKAVQKSQVNANTRDWGTAITEKDLSPILVDGKQMYYRTDHPEQFDISGKIDTENPIFKFYEKEVGRYLKNKYNATLITDPQGVKWWEVKIDKSMKKLPIEAFGAAPLLLGNNNE